LIQKQAFGGIKTFPKGSKNLNRFIDKDGLFRMKTRLCNRNDTADFKTLVLLSKFGLGVEQLIRQIHVENNHAGIQTTIGILSEQVWLIQTRAVGKVIEKCVTSRRFNAKLVEVMPFPLRENRVQRCENIHLYKNTF